LGEIAPVVEPLSFLVLAVAAASFVFSPAAVSLVEAAVDADPTPVGGLGVIAHAGAVTQNTHGTINKNAFRIIAYTPPRAFRDYRHFMK